MVGDFVNVNDLPLRVGAIRQDELGFFDNDYKIYWCSDDEFDRIDPIPLSEDILVKNGFVKGRDDDVTTFKCGNLFLFYYPDGTGLYNYNSQIVINYVHQLQHLLRLCGIEKEITI